MVGIYRKTLSTPEAGALSESTSSATALENLSTFNSKHK
jgi:hypothetical protein